VQRGEAPLGIVYYTDAIQTGQVRIVATFNGSLHAPIEYVAVEVAPPTPDGTPKDATARLLAYLGSEPSRKIYRKFGFLAR
jgi:molybdate transport system substrate-binding protein